MKHMKSTNMIRRAMCLFACALLVLTMLPGAQPAALAETGTIKAEFQTVWSGMEAVEQAETSFDIYRIGDAAPAEPSGWKVDAAYEDFGIFEATESNIAEVSRNVYAQVLSGSATPVQNQPADADGKVVFSGLPAGVYIIGLPKNETSSDKALKVFSTNSTMRVTPIIMTVPTVELDENEKKIVTYEPKTREIKPEYTKYTEVPAEKKWEDFDNKHEIQPSEITVKLLANGKEETAAALNGEDVPTTVKLNKDNDWKSVFSNLRVADNEGKKVTYTIEEIAVNGYTTEITGDASEGYTITNTLDTVDVPVVKEWKDFDDEYGLRPKSITVILLSNGTEKDSIELNADNKWRHTFTNLPEKDAEGKAYTYTVKEIAVNGYKTEITGDASEGYTITNTLKTVEIPVTKEWDDFDDKFGVRAQSVHVQLLQNGTAMAGKTHDMTAAEKWTYTFVNLPEKDSKDAPYTYTVEETPVLGYEDPVYTKDPTTGAITIKNPLELTEKTITKTWVDTGNEDCRPKTITVHLFKGETEVDSATFDGTGNKWSYTFRNLAKCDENGEEIEYTVTEDTVVGYSKTISKLDITNTLDTTEVKVTKAWTGAGDSAARRPSRITVRLMNGTTEVAKHDLTSSMSWTYTFTNLPKYDSKTGKEINYTVKEDTPGNGYSLVGITGDATNGYTITNTRPGGDNPPPPPGGPTPTPGPTPTVTASLPPTTQVRVEKIWDDENNIHGIRPASIAVQLYANGNRVTSATLTAPAWSYTFTNLPITDASGEQITYTVQETPVSGYETSISGTTITNRLIPREPTTYVDVAGTKTWDDNDNMDGTRPSLVTVTLLRNGVAIAQRTVTAGTNWTYAFENLPADDGYGNTYVYTIRESGVPGYFSRVDGYNLINTPLIEDYNTPLAGLRQEEMEDLLDLYDYETPLFGRPLKTGDEIPMYPFIFAGIGATAVILLLVFGRRRKREEVKK